MHMGIDKGKGATTSLHPTAMSPPLAPFSRNESRIPQRITNHTPEASMHYTPEKFSYRDQYRTAFMALTSRAATMSSLYMHRCCGMIDWDESNAYFMVILDNAQDRPKVGKAALRFAGYSEWSRGVVTTHVEIAAYHQEGGA